MSGFWVFGAIPPQPAGGVSTFVERLVHSRYVRVDGVIDPYWGKKNQIGPKHIIPKGQGIMQRMGVILHLMRLRNDRLLINCSNPRGAILLTPFLFWRHKATFLILHHGNLQLSGGIIAKIIFKFAMRQFSYVGCLSERQLEFYRSQGVGESKLVLVHSYLPPIRNSAHEKGPLLEQVLSWLKRSDGKLAISSGYAEDFYHHDWLLDALRDTTDFPDLRYVVCCYGPKTSTLDALKTRAAGLEQVLVVHGLMPAEFDVLLECADVYVRPTDVDSFGIAAWDAAARNLAVVASDVCRRPPESLVHPQGDRPKFLTSVRAALDGRRSSPHHHADEEYMMKVESFLQLGDDSGRF